MAPIEYNRRVPPGITASRAGIARGGRSRCFWCIAAMLACLALPGCAAQKGEESAGRDVGTEEPADDGGDPTAPADGHGSDPAAIDPSTADAPTAESPGPAASDPPESVEPPDHGIVPAPPVASGGGNGATPTEVAERPPLGWPDESPLRSGTPSAGADGDPDGPGPLALRPFNPIRGEGDRPAGSDSRPRLGTRSEETAGPRVLHLEPEFEPGSRPMTVEIEPSDAPLAAAPMGTRLTAPPAETAGTGAAPAAEPPAAEQPAAEPPAAEPPATGGAVDLPEDEPAAELPSAELLVTEEATEQPESESAEPEGNFEVVEVYYATDRAAVGADQPATVTPWLLATGTVLVLSALMALGGWLGRRRVWLRWAAIGGLGLSVMLGVATVLVAFQAPLMVAVRGDAQSENSRKTTAAEKPAMGYGNRRGTLQYGTCRVSIPESHEIGELEAPSVWKFEFTETPERHVVLMSIDPRPADEFFARLRACVEQSQRRSAFVFVHGFNVTFEDAARRTAQIAYDLKFDGAPVFYSWPSQGGLLKYTIDENNVRWSVQHLREFLVDFARRSGAEQIHLIAHSMGNRALTGALRDLAFLPEEERPTFKEIILTAPDIDAGVFRTDIAPHIAKTADRVTLYASSNDTALSYSKQIHGYPRAGDTGEDLLVLPGMDTIDVSAVDTSLLGHNYYGDNDSVLADIFEVLHEAKPPAQRRWLQSARRGNLHYWVFRP